MSNLITFVSIGSEGASLRSEPPTLTLGDPKNAHAKSLY